MKLKALISISLFSAVFVLISGVTLAQSVIDSFDDSEDSDQEQIELVTETIARVSLSRRIYVITNENESFDKGDFISILLNDKLVCRAIVAKAMNGIAGIKVVKVYSTPDFNVLRAGLEVKIIRGDDSFFDLAKRKRADQKKDLETIKDESDLYNETTFLDDNLSLEENKLRLIKTDNIIALNYGLIEALNTDGSIQSYTHLNGSWAYQFQDNIWGELGYGQNLIADYPVTGLDTQLSSIYIRFKYTIKAPFYSYIMPYIGFQSITASSPSAGDSDATDPQAEIDMVEKLNKRSLTFGVSLLKRLVPGWFVQGNLGSDLISFGFSLEF